MLFLTLLNVTCNSEKRVERQGEATESEKTEAQKVLKLAEASQLNSVGRLAYIRRLKL